MRISDCSSDVCSSDLVGLHNFAVEGEDGTLCFVPGPDQQRQISFNIAPGDQWRRDLANGHTYAERSELRQNGRMKKGVIYWNAFDFVVDNFARGSAKTDFAILAQYHAGKSSILSRSEKSPVGKECVSKWRSRWSA